MNEKVRYVRTTIIMDTNSDDAFFPNNNETPEEKANNYMKEFPELKDFKFIRTIEDFNNLKLSNRIRYVNNKNETVEQISLGSLYMIDDNYSPISAPVINSQTFKNLTFIDNEKTSKTLNLNITSNKPTNNEMTINKNNTPLI